jgi:hypothetical protein
LAGPSDTDAQCPRATLKPVGIPVDLKIGGTPAHSEYRAHRAN